MGSIQLPLQVWAAMDSEDCITGLVSGMELLSIYLGIINATLNLLNCVGGSGVNDNYGVAVSTTTTATTVSAPAIIAKDIMGGPGSNNNYGLHIVADCFLGTSATQILTVDAGSLGTGSNNYGISVLGSVTVGNGGTMTLIGSGGGLYSGTDLSQNYGVFLNNCTLTAGSGGSAATTINITGMGGQG